MRFAKFLHKSTVPYFFKRCMSEIGNHGSSHPILRTEMNESIRAQSQPLPWIEAWISIQIGMHKFLLCCRGRVKSSDNNTVNSGGLPEFLKIIRLPFV